MKDGRAGLREQAVPHGLTALYRNAELGIIEHRCEAPVAAGLHGLADRLKSHGPEVRGLITLACNQSARLRMESGYVAS